MYYCRRIFKSKKVSYLSKAMEILRELYADL